MHDVLIIGGGNIGEMIADLLGRSGNYAVTVADRSPVMLERVKTPGVRTLTLDVRDEAMLDQAMAGRFAVISAAPYHLTAAIAHAAHKAGTHYLDLTEDVASTRIVTELAATARGAFIPQCGLAPGFISIVAKDLAGSFDSVELLRLRVGALPLFPTNALHYYLTWSTDGVINEYCEPCEAIMDGKRVAVPALEQLEQFALDGVSYEAFSTSGGLGSLCDTLAGGVRNLNYGTIRYPGHRDIMRILLQDLRLSERRDLLREVLENAIPATDQDVVVIFVTAIGRRHGRLMQQSYVNKVYARHEGSRTWAAIQVTTASAVCAVLDLLADGKIAQQGLIRQEDIPLPLFLANRFGKAYAAQQGEVSLATEPAPQGVEAVKIVPMPVRTIIAPVTTAPVTNAPVTNANENPAPRGTLHRLLADIVGESRASTLFRLLTVHPALLADIGETVSRAIMAEALNLLLFEDLLTRVPAARAYADDRLAAGERIFHDHGALRTVAAAGMGALPAGEEAITRILRPLGYVRNGVYPLDGLKMTGRSYAQSDYPADIPQFFVSELHPERFSAAFQDAVGRVTGNSKDPLTPAACAALARLEAKGSIDMVTAAAALPVLIACFDRQHEPPMLADYETLLAESPEMAWIATEGNAFNHATDRVADVEALAGTQRQLGRPIKESVEISQSGRVRQTAFRAATVRRNFRTDDGATVEKEVPGSFYEFITRHHMTDTATGGRVLDLGFDSANAQGIFAMTARKA